MNNLGNKAIMAKNIQYYLNQNKKDRTDLCTDLGFKYTTVSNWLQGVKYPRIDKIELMARYFGVTKADLVEEHKPTPPVEEFTQADKDLVYAYHSAPKNAQQVVDLTLEPYKPGSSDDDPIPLDEATRKDLKKAFDDGATKDRAMFKKKDEDTPVPSKPSIPIVTGTVKKEIPEYLDMIVNSEEELMLLIEKAYTGANTDKVKKLVRNVIEELSYSNKYEHLDISTVCYNIATLVKQNIDLLLTVYCSSSELIQHLKSHGVIRVKQDQLLMAGMC